MKDMGKRYEQTFIEVDIQMEISTWKDVQHYWLSWKCKLKPQWAINTHSSKWLRLIKYIVITPNTVRMQRKCITHELLMGTYDGAAALKDSGSFFIKLNLWLPYDPAIVLWGIYPRKMETYVRIKIHEWTSRAALFVRAKKQNQFKYPSTGEWLSKLWYTHTMQYYKAIKRN